MKNIFFLVLVFVSETALCEQLYKNSHVAIYNDYPVLTFKIFAPEANLLKAAFVKQPYEFCSSDNSFKIDCVSSVCKIKILLTSPKNLNIKVPFVEQALSKTTCSELASKFKSGYYRFDDNNLELGFSKDETCVLEYFNLKNYSNRKIDAIFKEFLKYKKAERHRIKNFPGDIKDFSWVKNKLQALVNMDQKGRSLWIQCEHDKLKPIDKIYFKKISKKKLFVDAEYTSELKELLNKYNWFVISKFGAEADHNGWLLVQHQDHDREFQKMVLKRLEKLYRIGETSKSNYAYLHDRIAAAENRPQKYGTQGSCIGVGLWKPDPLEDERLVDKFRKDVGLESMFEYKKGFKDICL